MKFTVGQRVRLTKDCDFAKAGMTGRVVVTDNADSKNTLVEFDKPFSGGHAALGRCGAGRGHWVYPSYLTPLSESKTKYQPGDEVTVRSDLNGWKTYHMNDGENPMDANDQMLTKRGKKVKIKSVTKTGKYMIEGSIFPWVDEMFEDEKPKTETKSKSKSKSNSEIYTVVGVQLKDNDRIYNYLCDLEDISIDNEVRVPVGKANALMIGKVVSIGKHTKTNAPYNVDQMKKVLRIVESVKGCRFAVGDRVNDGWGHVGTVICIKADEPNYGVEWDAPYKGYEHDCIGFKLTAGKTGTRRSSSWMLESAISLVNKRTEPKTEPKVEYYTGRVVCVKSTCPCWTVGKIYKVDNGTIKGNQGYIIERLIESEIKHIGCPATSDRQRERNEFLPIVE